MILPTRTTPKPSALGLALWLAASTAAAQRYDITASTLVGGAGDDAIRGVRVLADGTVVAVGSLAPGVPAGVAPTLLRGATGASRGAAVRFTPDGRSVLSVTRFGADAWDLAGDARDTLYIAAGDDGLVVLDATARSLVRAAAPGHVHRVDAAPDGTVVALVPSNVGAADATPGAGRVVVYAPDGRETARFDGWRNTFDVAVDPASQTVVAIGWRQASAFDGSSTQPVQIAYLRGYSLAGEVRWTDYDWSTDRAAPGFLNRVTNNMADTRGLRVAMGRDGRLYAAFECAGGNHIFRYDPRDITRPAEIVGGDAYHTFSNTRSEHKTFFARYAPADGAYVLGQQLVGRLQSGAGNTVRVSEGAIAADEAGRVYLAGTSAYGLPLTFTPPMTGSYTGGAHLVVMSPDLRTRLHVTRLDPGGQSHAVDARTLVGDAPTVALAGRTSDGGAEFFRREAVQPASGGGRDGFVAVFHGDGDASLPTPDAGAVDASPPARDVAPIDAAPTRDDDAGDATPETRDAGDIDGSHDVPAHASDGCGCVAAGRAPRAPAGAVAALALIMARRRRGASRSSREPYVPRTIRAKTRRA